ncbi:MAG: hypothetical protein ACXVJD_17900 [Mucilaginibacter sp.]
MKRLAILSITAFYLLLTTGMFVCVVHCAAENLGTKPAMSMAGAKKHCAEKKDCDCCKKHGSFIIKESTRPAADLQFAQTAILIRHAEIPGFLLNASFDQDKPLHESNAPPGRSGRFILIQNRSLLI